jgi:hypothetical protein
MRSSLCCGGFDSGFVSLNSALPTDTPQRNTYEEWIAMARQADYNVLWLPLSDEYAGAKAAAVPLVKTW